MDKSLIWEVDYDPINFDPAIEICINEDYAKFLYLKLFTAVQEWARKDMLELQRGEDYRTFLFTNYTNDWNKIWIKGHSIKCLPYTWGDDPTNGYVRRKNPKQIRLSNRNDLLHCILWKENLEVLRYHPELREIFDVTWIIFDRIKKITWWEYSFVHPMRPTVEQNLPRIVNVKNPIVDREDIQIITSQIIADHSTWGNQV